MVPCKGSRPCQASITIATLLVCEVWTGLWVGEQREIIGYGNLIQRETTVLWFLFLFHHYCMLGFGESLLNGIMHVSIAMQECVLGGLCSCHGACCYIDFCIFSILWDWEWMIILFLYITWLKYLPSIWPLHDLHFYYVSGENEKSKMDWHVLY